MKFSKDEINKAGAKVTKTTKDPHKEKSKKTPAPKNNDAALIKAIEGMMNNQDKVMKENTANMERIVESTKVKPLPDNVTPLQGKKIKEVPKVKQKKTIDFHVTERDANGDIVHLIATEL